MLAVIFGILKILGLLVLGILGLILLVLCLILFVPICYRAQMSLYERFCAEATVSWLFRAISLTVCHREETEISVKIFGIPLGKKKRESDEDDSGESREDSSKKEFKREESEKTEIKKEPTAELSKKAEEQSGKESDKKTREEPDNHNSDQNSDCNLEDRKQRSAEQKAEVSGKQEILEVREPVKTSRKEERKADSSEKNGSPKKQNKIVRIFRKIPEKIKKFWGRLKKFWKGIGKRLRHICSNLQELNEKRRRLMEFLQKEENKRVFRLLKCQAVRFFRHIFPQKLSGKLTFSLGDPYLTGKVLTYVSPFYGFYGRDFALTPVFDAEELVLEGETELKGRVRIGTLLWIGFRIVIDKDARRLWKTWRNTRR